MRLNLQPWDRLPRATVILLHLQYIEMHSWNCHTQTRAYARGWSYIVESLYRHNWCTSWRNNIMINFWNASISKQTVNIIWILTQLIVTTEPSNEGNLSLGFIQLRTHQHLQRNTTNAWYETSNHLTSTCDTNDQAKQCNSARHVIRLISGGIETKPSHWSLRTSSVITF